MVTADIPAALRHEELDGRVLYRKGTLDVLRGLKSYRDIMGSSSLQAIIVSALFGEVIKFLPENYLAVVSEPGLHIAHNANVANDIAIFQTSQIARFDKKYFAVPPEVVIEVDVKIEVDLTAYGTPEGYILHKTQAMLNFGVQTVIWVLTEDPRKIIIAETGQDWRITDWTSNVVFAPGCSFSLNELLQRRGLLDLL